MADNFPNGYLPSATGAFAVTPSDGADLALRIRAVTINVSGVISYVGWDGVTNTTATLPAGTYPLLAKRIRATGTTATAITGWI